MKGSEVNFKVDGLGPLSGVRIIDLTRLAPGPYCTMLLADMGAEVVVVGGGRSGLPVPELSRGKRFISLDLKTAAGVKALQRLAEKADVVIEGFRPGVMKRMHADYETLRALNPRLIYCSLTGYGQDGPRALEAGHDINYLAISGVLGAVGPADRPPYPPLNLLADFGGGGLLAAFGIVAALFERSRSGHGQYVDSAMIDGCISMMAMHFPIWRTSVMEGRGQGLLAGIAPFYRCYECACGGFVAVGALERAFFVALWTTLDLGDPPDHMRKANWGSIEARLDAIFRTRTRDDWAKHFIGVDACVTPVLAPDEIWSEPQVKSRISANQKAGVPPIPRFSRSPATAGATDVSDQTGLVLEELGFSASEISELICSSTSTEVKGLTWPPKLD